MAVRFAEDTRALATAKGRPVEKPIAWLVGSPADFDEYGSDVSDYAKALADAFWPGVVTLVVGASSNVPETFRTKRGTIGLRMPSHEGVCSLIDRIGSPIAATSANLAGADSIPSSEHLDNGFVQASGIPMLDFAAWQGEDALASAVLAEAAAPDSVRKAQGKESACASAVIDCTGSAPKLLRAGTISASDIESACGLPVCA